MPDSALGRWLKSLREDRDLSLREVAQRAGVDHAYVHRLETGAKEAPSSEVIEKLITALTPLPRDAEILRLLASLPNIDPNLADFARGDATVSAQELHVLTTVVNRGARPDYATSLARIRIMMGDEDG
jgi:transcriptional regulator with XRE-family HTH domain